MKKIDPRIAALSWAIIPLGNIILPLLLAIFNIKDTLYVNKCIYFLYWQIKFLFLIILSIFLSFIPGGGIFVNIFPILFYFYIIYTLTARKNIYGKQKKFIFSAFLVLLFSIGCLMFYFNSSNSILKIVPPYSYQMDNNTMDRIKIIESNGGKYLSDTVFEYAELSAMVYYDTEPPVGIPWTHIESYENKISGFQAGIFEHYDKAIVIAFRGTELSLNDFFTDLTMGAGIIPQQFKDAENVLAKVKIKYPERIIKICGHSLGGAISQYISGKYSLQGYSFNAFGAKDLIGKEYRRNASYSMNYIENFDVISGFNIKYTIIGSIISAVKYANNEMPNQFGINYIYYSGYDFLNVKKWHSAWQVANDAIFIEEEPRAKYGDHQPETLWEKIDWL